MSSTSNSIFTNSITLGKISAQTSSSTSISLGKDVVKIAAVSLKYNDTTIATTSDVSAAITNLKAASIGCDTGSLGATNIQTAIDILSVKTRDITGSVGLTTFASDVAMSKHRITGLGTPTASTDASTKGYADSVSAIIPYAVGSVSIWTTRAAPDFNFTSVCWSTELGLFVAVSATGDISSRDGITWASVTSSENIGWNKVCWSAKSGKFVAVGDSGKIKYSSNGTDWTSGVSPGTNNWKGVCWSTQKGLFVAVSYTGTGNRVMTSNDGISWTGGISSSDNSWFDVCWSAELGIFVAVGYGANVMTSEDGKSWTSTTSFISYSWFQSVCWSAKLGIFVAVASSGTDRVMTSTNGTKWTSRTSPVNDWNSVCWSGELGIFVAVASSGTGDRVMSSADGINWTSRPSAADNKWGSVCWSGELGLFVAASYSGSLNRVMSSSLTGRPPTSYNVFNSSFNNIDTTGNWNIKSNSIYSDGNITITPSSSLIVSGSIDTTASITLWNPERKFNNSIISASTINHSYTLPPVQGSASSFLSNNGSGILSWQKYLPSIYARIYSSAATSIVTGSSLTAITLGAVTTTDGNISTSAANAITINQPGLYLINAQMGLVATDKTGYAQLCINLNFGVYFTISTTTASSSTSYNRYLNTSTIRRLIATDKITLSALQSTPTSLTINGSNETYLEVTLLGL